MQWGGPESQRLFEAVYKETGQHHPACLRKPTLRSDCIKYHDAYRSLGVARIWSEVGPMPIPLVEVEAYLRLAGIGDPSTKLKYLRLIRRMDMVELEHLRAKARTPWKD